MYLTMAEIEPGKRDLADRIAEDKMTPTTKEINKAKAIGGRNRTEKVDE
jgi:hypothetical protein